MNERKWLSFTAPLHVQDFVSKRASDRKLRLFTIACCRRIWHLIASEPLRGAVELAERYADGKADEDERDLAYRTVQREMVREDFDDRRSIFFAVINAVSPPPLRWISVSGYTASALQWDAFRRATAAGVRNLPPGLMNVEYAAQAELLRCILGNPFRPATVDLDWLSWSGGTIRSIAQTIYHQHRFAELPVLADALEESGCTDAHILNHCRQSGEHVRGCWVVDLLLAKS